MSDRTRVDERWISSDEYRSTSDERWIGFDEDRTAVDERWISSGTSETDVATVKRHPHSQFLLLFSKTSVMPATKVLPMS
jgi:hypothetical protein